MKRERRFGIGDIICIIQEYGLKWVFYRFLYIVKIKMLNLGIEGIFEKKVDICRSDFFDIDTFEIERYLSTLLGDDKKEIIKRADLALEGKIYAFSSQLLDYGQPIDWQLNPLTGKRTNSETKWYKIPDFDLERGDIKVIWEISRFSHLYYFLRAYMLTKNEKYYNGFSTQISDWLRNNPYSYGANYKCGQECTLRMMNVACVYSGFMKYGLTTEQDKKNVEEIIKGSYKKVLSNFFYAHKCIKNDHTISELCGMVIGAWCANDDKRKTKAFMMLEKQLDEQITEDGVFLIYSVNYQRFIMQLMEYMLKICPTIGCVPSEKTLLKLRKASLFIYQLLSDEGAAPKYGANDGTFIFPVNSSGADNYFASVDAMIGLTCHKELETDKGDKEEYLWFKNTDQSRCTLVHKKKTTFFKEAGIYTFYKKNYYLMFNAHNYKRRPGHMDQMHIDLWLDGKNVLCDTGTYSYVEELGRIQSGTVGHNTVKVEDCDQMRQISKFLVYGVPKIYIHELNENFVEAEFVGKTGYTHTRKINMMENIITINDLVQLKGEKKSVKILYHTLCDLRLHENSIYFMNGDKKLCSMEVNNGTIKIGEFWYSKYYLRKEKINLIEILCNQSDCTTIIRLEE